MKLLFILFFLFLSILHAQTELKSNYMVRNDYVLLSDIIKNVKSDTKLFFINQNRHIFRIRTKELLQKLNKLGYKDISSKHSYTQFSKKSLVDTKRLEEFLKQLYKKYYANIEIQDITVTPRSYLKSLPKYTTISTNKSAYLSAKGVLSIKTQENKKIFFNYYVNAKIKVVIAKENIHKESELSLLNVKKKSIMLNKFRALPLQEIQKASLQAKHTIKKDSIVTSRDVVALLLVKRGANIQVVVKDSNIAISFSAKAKQDGRIGDTITIVNAQGKRLKAVVTAKNSAEIR